MWFKNLHVFRFTKPFELSPEELGQQLAEHEFTPCSSQDLLKYGWVPPLGRHGSEFIHAANGNIMICAKRQEKVLPSAVINEQLVEQVEAIQTKEGRHVGRKEKQTLKEEITFSLLPKAFTRSSLQFAYIAPKEGLIIVNSGSANRAQELLNHLRESIVSLPVIPLASKNTPQHVMTSWLETGELPKNFELGHECELRDPSDEGAVIRCKHQDLQSPDILNHINSGMYISKLGLCWKEGIEFTIDSDLVVKRLSFDDEIQEKASPTDAGDAAEQFDIEFSVMTLELAALIKGITRAFGGVKKESAKPVVTETAAEELEIA